ncbi:MAG: sulfite exporter TauE/SafE family protein [Bacteroidia bacterium]|nr:sulfite exporter TauE/SafE family protein [Bacteroidia bacterium]
MDFRLRSIGVTMLIMKGLLIAFLLWTALRSATSGGIHLQAEFYWFLLAGFVAQLIDGALGMAYGVSCSSLLLSMGVPPAVASASVHTAEVFTTGFSGLSHLYLKNINKALFLRIVVTGVIGAMLGAYLISQVFDGGFIKPYISAYLLILGVVILVKAFRQQRNKASLRRVPVLGFFGGLMDAIGGGGWGPIVTSNLIQRGVSPRKTVGTVNVAEFFVAFFGTGVFMVFNSIDSWQPIMGLILGGLPAAPVGAWLVSKIKPRTLMILVGILIIAVSALNIVRSFT